MWLKAPVASFVRTALAGCLVYESLSVTSPGEVPVARSLLFLTEQIIVADLKMLGCPPPITGRYRHRRSAMEVEEQATRNSCSSARLEQQVGFQLRSLKVGYSR